MNAAHREYGAQGAAPAIFHHIAQLRAARRLADQAPVDCLTLLLQVIHDLDRAIVGRALLIGSNQEADAAAVPGVGADKVFAGHEHGREAAFHVGGAATVEHALAQCGFEGRAIPAGFGAGGHHIGVPGKHQQGAAVSAHRPEVLDVAETQRCAAEAQAGQAVHHQCLAPGVFGRD